MDLAIILGNLDDYHDTEKKNVDHSSVHYPFGAHTTPAKLWERRYSCQLALQNFHSAQMCLRISVDILKGKDFDFMFLSHLMLICIRST